MSHAKRKVIILVLSVQRNWPEKFKLFGGCVFGREELGSIVSRLAFSSSKTIFV
jgi:hypothetical protein